MHRPSDGAAMTMALCSSDSLASRLAHSAEQHPSELGRRPTRHLRSGRKRNRGSVVAIVEQTRPRGADEVASEVRAWLKDNWDPELTLAEWWERLADSGWAGATRPEE